MVEIDEHDHAGFAIDLKKSLQIMDAYEAGGHAYHTTLPTDAIAALHDMMKETEAFQASGVVVSYTDNDGFKSGAKFIAAGLQTAAGVPLQCDEPADFKTFRIGLFGLDKLRDIDRTVWGIWSGRSTRWVEDSAACVGRNQPLARAK